MIQNILLITTDQHRWDYVGYMQHPTMQGLTPNLDRLAANGAIFENCYSPNPLCMPTRHAMQSGLYTFQSGQMNNIGDWPLDFPTFPQILKNHGYHTILTGKLHAHEAVGFDIDLTDKVWADQIHSLGFDEVTQVAGKTMDFFTDDDYTHYLADHGLLDTYREDLVKRQEAQRRGEVICWPSVLPEEHYIDNFIGRTAAQWLTEYTGEQPFLHIVSFCSPHVPFDAPQSAVNTVDMDSIVLPAHNDAGENLRQRLANYAAQIRLVDENIGKLLAILEQRGWLDDTLIIFTADHGEMLGDVKRWGKCNWLDGSIRVPLLLRYPGWTGPQRVEQTMASCHDIAATIIDFALAGSDIGNQLPGSSSVSLRPFLTGEADQVRDAIYSENGGQFGRPWRLMDNGDYRYLWFLDTDEELLFDRHADPYCQNDIAASPVGQSALHSLRRKMLEIHVTHPAPKTGHAAYSPGTSHSINRATLESRKLLQQT